MVSMGISDLGPTGHDLSAECGNEAAQDTTVETRHSHQQANGAEPKEIISLCIGCLKENCSQRSELKCCPVTICAMRQAK